MSVLELIITIGAAGAVVLAVWRWVVPRLRAGASTYGAFKDAVLGREAVTHPDTGAELVPAQPGLGARMATVEAAVVALAQTNTRIDEVAAVAHDNRRRIARLEKADQERALARTESIELLRTIDTALRSDNQE